VVVIVEGNMYFFAIVKGYELKDFFLEKVQALSLSVSLSPRCFPRTRWRGSLAFAARSRSDDPRTLSISVL